MAKIDLAFHDIVHDKDLDVSVVSLHVLVLLLVTADYQVCIEDGTVSQIVRQRTLAATAALTLA